MHQPFTGETFLADTAGGARFRHDGSETRLRTRADATLADAVLYSTHPAMLQHAGTLARSRNSPRAAGCNAGAATATDSRWWRREAST